MIINQKTYLNDFFTEKEIIFYNSQEEVLSKFSELNNSFAKAKGSNMAHKVLKIMSRHSRHKIIF